MALHHSHVRALVHPMLLLVGFLILSGSCLVQAEELEVARVSTGVFAQRLLIDPDGRFAAVFGQSTAGQGYMPSDVTGQPTEVAVVDLQKRAVVARSPIVGVLGDALIDGEQLVWSLKKGTLLYRLKFNGAQEAEANEIGRPLTEFCPLDPQRYLSIELDVDDVPIYVVRDRQTLQAAPVNALGDVPPDISASARSVLKVGDGMLFASKRVLNSNDLSTRCFVLDGRSPLRIAANNMPIHASRLFVGKDVYWHRIKQDFEVWRFYGQETFPLQGRLATISMSHPAIARLGQWESDDAGNVRLKVELCDLNQGAVQQELTLSATISVLNSQLPLIMPIRLEGNKLVVGVRDEVLIGALAADDFNTGFPEPLRMLYPTTSIVDVDKPYKLQIAAKGGVPPYEFSLSESDINDPESSFGLFNVEPPPAPVYLPLSNAVVVSETTGNVDVDLPQIWKGLRAGMERSLLMYDSGQEAMGGMDLRFFGVIPPDDKMFVQVPLQFHVTDRRGEYDEITITLIALAPKSEYKAAMAKGDAVRAKIRKNRQRLRRGFWSN